MANVNEKELENLRIQNKGLIQRQHGLLDQVSAAGVSYNAPFLWCWGSRQVEKQKFIDKQNTLRNENQGLRERVDQLLIHVS